MEAMKYEAFAEYFEPRLGNLEDLQLAEVRLGVHS